MEMERMSAMLETVKVFFYNDEWFYVEMESRPVLRMNHWGANGRFSCQAEINEEQQIFYFYSYFPVNVPAEKRTEMAEFITRANYGMRVGNFEMDFVDGEVRFKTSLDVENDELTPALISNQVYTNVWTMDRYLPGLFAMVYSDKTPLEAIEMIEE
jgi:hypothetical protein